MHSRGHYHNRPPHHWGPTCANDWNGYHDNMLPPSRQLPSGPPPPEHDRYYHRPNPRHPDDRLPPQDFCNDYFYNDFEQAPPQRHPPRGRGRGQNNCSRGQSYSRGRGSGYSGPNKPFKDEKKEPALSGSKPAWLSQPVDSSTSNTMNNTGSTSSSSSARSSKPAWLTKGTTTATGAATSNNTSSNQSSTMPSPTATPPILSVQASTPTLKQLPSSLSSAEPAWLSQTVNYTSSNTTTTSSKPKPAWMSASIKTENNPSTTSSSNTSSVTMNTNISSATMNNKPQNNVKPKPKWLTQSSGIKPILKSIKLPVSQPAGDADSLPPPPPPVNQPNIHTELQQQQNLSNTVQPPIPTVVVQSRPVRKIKDESEVKVALPGQKNYISYKNTLQEFCQKRGLSVPQYKCFKNGYGFSATVDVYTGKKIRSSGINEERKEAEQCAAFEALKSMGLLQPDAQFVNPAPGAAKAAKRQMPSPQTVAKKLKNEISTSSNTPNYKAQLNEFCQKFHLPVPTYETTSSGGGYVTKLFYNKKEYLSTCPQPSKKAAEMNVAQLVLSKVNQAPPPSEPIEGPIVYPNLVLASSKPMGNTDDSTTSSGTSAQPNATVTPIRSVQDLGNLNVSPVISYKNKLQEACQKRRTVLPVYNTYKDGYLHSCSVVVQGQTFSATGCKTKKGAEQSAALVALEALGLLNK